jgi:hypothetical protein
MGVYDIFEALFLSGYVFVNQCACLLGLKYPCYRLVFRRTPEKESRPPGGGSTALARKHCRGFLVDNFIKTLSVSRLYSAKRQMNRKGFGRKRE